MREIKFRGLMTTGEWVYGYLTEDAPDSTRYYETCPFRIHWHDEQGQHNAPVKKETVGQFTCLKDRNGVEIYEGDVIKTSLGVIAVVEWEKAGRFLGFTEKRELVYIGREPLVQVIGNIHENRELLEAPDEA
jgi:hypothetical protein